MQIESRQYGKSIFEVKITTHESKIEVDVCDLDGIISGSLIEQLEDLIYEMKEWNDKNKIEK